MTFMPIALLLLAQQAGAPAGEDWPPSFYGSLPQVRFDRMRIRVAPSAALRSAAVAGLPPLGARGRRIDVPCLVARQRDGRVMRCRIGRTGDQAYAAARRVALGYRFDTAGLPGAPLPLPVRMSIPVHLTEADRRSSDFVSRPLVGFSLLSVVARPDPDIASSYYPLRGLSRSQQAIVALTCEVQADNSIFCAQPRVSGLEPDPNLAAEFEIAALQFSSFVRVAPFRTDGAAAPGSVFLYRIVYRLPPDD